MLINAAHLFFDHSRHSLKVRGVETPLHVLAFTGDEALSQPFTYRIEFTSTSRDLPADAFLRKDASFSLRAPPEQSGIPGYTPPVAPPLRTLYGTITHFALLSVSRDEARYEVTLAPRLKLLDRARQYRIYQNQSVPEIVEQVLRRNEFEGQDFLFELTRDYPQREQVMQYGEDDLVFIQRLLAEVGIWYRFSMDERLRIDVLEFHDDQRHYLPAPPLPLRPLSSLESSGQDAVWGLQSSHEAVVQQVSNRAYQYRDAGAQLDANVDVLNSLKTSYGEAYHYGEPHQKLGDAYARDEDLESESGYFYARLAHERYLNARTRLIGSASSAVLLPGQVLKLDGVDKSFAAGATIVRLRSRAARDRSFEVQFEAIPYDEQVCFRPEVPAKPVIAGSIPARVTSPEPNDLYGHIDMEGRYKCHFLFDRDTWPAGRESMWLRLARPYAGDTYGLHLPLIQGTEVRIAFENGDPDRPYIAHAIHDSQHPDHVTLKNYKRNVLRTPANNKLRLDDSRGQEHIKLSTEYSGKSQLNLGHLVDSQRQKRGEGFELRTDGWGSVRAGKGVFISADVQPGAQGQVLAMQEAVARLQQAGDEIQKLSTDAETANADPADFLAQIALMNEEVNQLRGAVALLSAPQGIAFTSGQHLQLAAERNLMLNAGGNMDASVVKRLFIGVGEGMSLFVRKLGLKLFANQGAVQIQAQNDRMELIARKGVDVTSTENEIHITAKKRIVINAGGSYLRMDQHSIEYGTQGDYLIKSVHYAYQGPASMPATHPQYPKLDSVQRLRLQVPQAPNAPHLAWAGMPYTLYADDQVLQKGVLGTTGYLAFDHQVVTRSYRLVMSNGVSYQIPIPSDYSNPEQGRLANQGLHHNTFKADSEVNQPAAHNELRRLYASLLQGAKPDEGNAS
ncbi:type VI secretion system tip protein VgrG [Pseudomonas sp. PDM18]|uniref:type VI secretion system Vgr family protein n=1 Tax=Pseudomonas sp. PDM18 TaxID=2769253 RepID=UPI00177A8D62|nr:type VI secretion system tip protein VgrG [Pseudomonas sp. PDM18]MBD9678380.1 type VI secretion system tip protein VgrG [Pseudomonas sp. PDM18]